MDCYLYLKAREGEAWRDAEVEQPKVNDCSFSKHRLNMPIVGYRYAELLTHLLVHDRLLTTKLFMHACRLDSYTTSGCSFTEYLMKE